jgi:ABC-type transport system involved in cytochrome c biogenesis permease subunit
VAAAPYSLGLLHAILTLVRKREHLFRVSLTALSIGAVLQCVSIGNFYETLSMCAFLITTLFLFVYWRYKTESLSVFIFPLIFVMTLVSTLGNPVDALAGQSLAKLIDAERRAIAAAMIEAGRPNCTVALQKVDEEHLGAFLAAHRV